jgi:hypothetical protein
MGLLDCFELRSSRIKLFKHVSTIEHSGSYL